VEQGKLTPGQVKEQLKGLKGRNKLAVLRQQLQAIQEAAKTKEDLEEEVRKAEEAKAKVAKKAAIAATPAHQKFHSLAAKEDSGLPLPYTYSFLQEVFRSTETIGAMLHNRQEIITVDKFKKGVEQMLRRNFSVDMIKRIRTVFPAAYSYAWQQMTGRYGKKLNDYEMHVTVNMDYRRETLRLEGGEVSEEEVVRAAKLSPSMVSERRHIFRNGLVELVKAHHRQFCLARDIPVEDARLLHFHPDFPLDACAEVAPTELPAKPELEQYQSAKDMLESARNLFEAAPRVSKVLEQVAVEGEETAGEKAQEKVEEEKVAEVPKALAGVSMSLLERIRAKEKEKKAREMYTSKEQETAAKRMKRLPGLARYVKSIFVTEQRNALKRPFLIQKVHQSYPGFVSKDVLSADLDKLAEVSAPWMTVRSIQGEVWMMVARDTDVNTVVAELEEKAGATA